MNNERNETEECLKTVSFGAMSLDRPGCPGPDEDRRPSPTTAGERLWTRRLGFNSRTPRGAPPDARDVTGLHASPSHRATRTNVCENPVPVRKEHEALRHALRLRRGEGRGEVTGEAGEPCEHRGQAATAPGTGPHGCRPERPSGRRLTPELLHRFLVGDGSECGLRCWRGLHSTFGLAQPVTHAARDTRSP